MHTKKEKEGEGQKEKEESRGRKEGRGTGKRSSNLFSLCRKSFLYSNKMKPEVKWWKCGLQRKEGGHVRITNRMD